MRTRTLDLLTIAVLSLALALEQDFSTTIGQLTGSALLVGCAGTIWQLCLIAKRWFKAQRRKLEA